MLKKPFQAVKERCLPANAPRYERKLAQDSNRPFHELLKIDELKMPRHIMVSTIFEKNRLDRLLKPILGESTPSYMVEKRHELV